jgi:hypothetical protein
MKRIGLITDYGKDAGSVRLALDLDELARTANFRLETIDDFRHVESVAQAVWSLINLVDVVVVYVTRESANLYYEIGLAHGFGKPVIIAVEDATSVPPDLMGQRILVISSQGLPIENLTFRLKEAIEETDRAHSFVGYRGPRDEPAKFPQSYTHEATPDFRSLFAYQGAARANRFEKWFADVARSIPGWEVIEAEKRIGKESGFDLVIWK